jgi:hypothetical protein
MVWVLVNPELLAWSKWRIWPFGERVVRLYHGKSDSKPYIVGNMFGEYHSLCTLKTSIVEFGKKKEHCSRYKSQNVWYLLKSPHMPSSPPWLIAFIIEHTIDLKSLTNVCHIKFVSSTPRHSSNRVSILNCGYRHWLTKQIKQTYKRNCCFPFNNKEQIREICEIL